VWFDGGGGGVKLEREREREREGAKESELARVRLRQRGLICMFRGSKQWRGGVGQSPAAITAALKRWPCSGVSHEGPFSSLNHFPTLASRKTSKAVLLEL
jgi:hypothetical protein